MDWQKLVPKDLAMFLRTVTRVALAATTGMLVLFLCWFVFSFLVHLEGLLTRTVFSHPW